MSEKTLKVAVPIVVVVLGLAAAVLVASFRRTPERVERPPLGPLVEVMPVSMTDVPIVIEGNGEVAPRVEVDLVPQVSGTVVAIHPALVSGGFFNAGDALVTIDPRDYQLALDRAQAAVARALVALERERAEADVARAEWDELHPGEEAPALVVREPQIRQAEAELAAAEAELAVAELSLERTRISVPFDGVVVSESVDIGQFVNASSRIAKVYGTDSVEVRVPLNRAELAWFTVGTTAGGVGSEAEVSTTAGGTRSVWKGVVTRLEAEVDPISRMVHVVVEITHPYDTSDGATALLPGTFVDVRIFGETASNVIPLPRYAVREGGAVWVYDGGTLDIRTVEIVRTDRRDALVASGLEDGDLVIVSALDAVTQGMTVRNAADQPTAGGDA